MRDKLPDRRYSGGSRYPARIFWERSAMTLVEPPPKLPEEERDTAEQPNRKAGRFERFRFSMTRLIIATAMAPLPLLLISHRYRLERYNWCFILACFTLFASVLWTKARDLPRLNMVAIFTVLPSFFLPVPFAIPVFAIFFAVPSFFFARMVYPNSENGGEGERKCISVLNSGVWLMGIIYLFAFCAVSLCFAKKPTHTAIGLVAMITLTAMVPLNLYWFATCPDETLDDRPDLGFRYETTMVLIPAAMLFAALRVIRL